MPQRGQENAVTRRGWIITVSKKTPEGETSTSYAVGVDDEAAAHQAAIKVAGHGETKTVGEIPANPPDIVSVAPGEVRSLGVLRFKSIN